MINPTLSQTANSIKRNTIMMTDITIAVVRPVAEGFCIRKPTYAAATPVAIIVILIHFFRGSGLPNEYNPLITLKTAARYISIWIKRTAAG